MNAKTSERKGWFLKADMLPPPPKTLRERMNAALPTLPAVPAVLRDGAGWTGEKLQAGLGLAGTAYDTATDGVRAKLQAAKGSWEERALWFNAALGSAEFSRHLDSFAQHAFTWGGPSIYDQAMDAAYNAGHQFGALHRLFDGSHDLCGAWQACREAGGDSLSSDVIGYVDAVLKDLFTAKGLPMVTLDHDGFVSLAQTLKESLHISPAWLYDAATVTGTELLGCVGGTLALALNWQAEDRTRFAELTGGLGVSAVVAANPLLAVVVMVCAARCYQTTRDGGAVSDLLAAAASGGATSAIGSVVVMGAMALLPGPAWVGLMVGICVSVLARKACISAGQAVGDLEWRETIEFVRTYVVSALKGNSGTDLVALPA